MRLRHQRPDQLSMRLWLLAFLVFLLVSGTNACAFRPFSSSQAPEEYKALPETQQLSQVVEEIIINDAEELAESVREMAKELVDNLADPDPDNGDLAEGLIVCTFVDLKKLKRTSSFGRYIAEQLMGEFQKNRYFVVEIRKSKDIFIKEKHGEYGLSRDPHVIRKDLSVGAMLTGTYTASDNQIIVNARVLDNRDAAVLSSATMVFPRSKFSNLLLADAKSATQLNKERVYKKRLEL